jgi:hypothetical protein
MQRHRAALAALLSVAVALTTGCSWIFTKPLPDNWQSYDQLDCSTSVLPPLVDGLFFVADTGSAIYLAASDNVPYKPLLVSAGLIEGALYLASAIYGVSKISACHRALVEKSHGYQPPEFGTGGEVFYPPPPPDAGAPPDAAHTGG